MLVIMLVTTLQQTNMAFYVDSQIKPPTPNPQPSIIIFLFYTKTIRGAGIIGVFSFTGFSFFGFDLIIRSSSESDSSR